MTAGSTVETSSGRRSEETHNVLWEIGTARDLSRLIPATVAAAARLAAADYAALALLRPDHAGYASYHHTGPGGEVAELPTDTVARLPMLRSLRLTDAPFRVDDLRLQPAIAGFPPTEQAAVVLLALPLRADRRLLGHLLMARSQPQPFSAGEEALAADLAETAACAVLRLGADEQIAALHSRAHRLVRTNLALMRQLRPDGVLQWAVNDVRAVLEAEAAAVVILPPPDGDGAGAFVHSGLAPGRRVAISAIGAGFKGLVAEAIELRRPVRLAYLSCDPTEAGFPGGHTQVTSFLSAPLIRQRRVIGLLYAANKRRAPEFSEDDERFITSLAAELARSRLLASRTRAPELVDRIAAASKALRHEMEATRTFLTSLSHELRGSISGILMSAELITDPGLGVVGDPERVRTVGDRIHSVAGNLLELVDNMLDLGRLEAGRLDVRSQPVDLSAVLGDVDEVIGPVALAAGVALEWPQLAGVPRLVADPIRLRQVLVNLFTNAVKFTPTGGRTWLELEVTADRVTLCVCDTGKGIAASETERIFQPFERAAESDVPGVGLGLAICRRIVELHASSLEVASQPGQGSRFSFALRRSREPLAPRLLRAPRSGAPATAVEPEAASILLVEDDPVNRQSISDVLVAAGHRVRAVVTRRAALEAVAKSSPDVVVLDVQLPDGNGLEIVSALRAASDRPTAVVALSADRIGDTAELAMDAGCDRFGLKPIPATDLLALVAEALRERRAVSAVRPGPTGLPSE